MTTPTDPTDPRDPRARHAALYAAHQQQHQQRPQHQGPSDRPAPADRPTPTPTTSRDRSGGRGRRWVELPTVAVLSAMLASATTYGIAQAGADGGPRVTGASTSAVPASLAGSDEQGWQATAEAVSPSVVAISVGSGRGGGPGSGVILDTQGHVVTNNHVVAAGGPVAATLADGRTYEAEVVGTDPSTDLAVLQLVDAPEDLQPIDLGQDDDVAVGQPVMAVGNPLGLAGTVTTGIVSALDRPVTTSEAGSDPRRGGTPVVTNAVQTSAAINPGNSGGALVDARGRLVGINSSIASLGGPGGQSGNIGIGFAIPVGKVASITDQLIEDGTAEHAFLGVGIDDAMVDDGSAQRSAAGITAVEEGSPAAEAGLRRGDVIIALDSENVEGALSLVAQVRDRSAGEETAVTYLRDGERQEATVILDVRAR